jgi:DNA-binding IclR family transcriptional regulator
LFSLLSLREKEIEQRQCRYDIKTKTAQIGESVEKSLKLIGLGMPQLRGWEIATGESAQVDG